ncbi:MAG TPA: hypothetical protein VIJ75_00415 [Hanamia sp.]
MEKNETLLINVSKRKHIGQFYLKIKSNMERRPSEQVNHIPESGDIDIKVAYEVEKAVKKIIIAAKEMQKTKALNWKVEFNQESYIEEYFGCRERVYPISEKEIDVIFKTLRIMDNSN